jgi:hypothetical protein
MVAVVFTGCSGHGHLVSSWFITRREGTKVGRGFGVSSAHISLRSSGGCENSGIRDQWRERVWSGLVKGFEV